MRAALVIGGAANVWQDVDLARAIGEFDGVVGCNDIAEVWPDTLDAAVSLDADKLDHWMAARAARGLPPHKALFTPRTTERRFPGQTAPGSSGLFALKVALVDLGFDRAVLCGVPMERAWSHFYDWREWKGADKRREGWLRALPQIRERARSVSGWTQTLLGAPDAAWVAPAPGAV